MPDGIAQEESAPPHRLTAVLRAHGRTETSGAAPSFDTNMLLDGAEISDPYFGSAAPLYLEEAIEEVQIMTNGISARYGRFQGGIVNATTKSGGNEFSGTLRADLFKESWGSQTPAGETLSDDLEKTYSGTVGGFIVKDHLWFFVGGRYVPTSQVSASTLVVDTPGYSEPTRTFFADTKRWRAQGKLRGAITANHTIEASYLDSKVTQSGNAQLVAAEPRAVGTREDPRKTYTLSYQGILSDRMFLDFRATKKDVSIIAGASSLDLGSPYLQYISPAEYRVWNNDYFSALSPEDRDNETLGVNATHVLSTGRWGDHTLEYGAQYVNSITSGDNAQSATGYNLNNYDGYFGFTGDPSLQFATVQPGGDVLFNLLSAATAGGDVNYRWVAIPIGRPQQDLKNTAAYVQDAWTFGKWRADVGLRWERYDASSNLGQVDLEFNELAPRLGLTYNLDQNWQLQATWGRYVSRINDNIAQQVSGVNNAPYISASYTGPDQLGITREQVEAALRDDANWTRVTLITDPRNPTNFLDPDLTAPYADDLNFSIKRALPRNTGVVRVTYTNRDYKDLLETYTGGILTLNPGTEAETLIDAKLWRNSPEAGRKYRAITTTFNWRPAAKWGIGGNYAYSTTKGNYEGEARNQPASASIIGDYPERIPIGLAAPWGYLSSDIRHRLRIWGDYRFDFGRGGSLTPGLIFYYRSGTPWSRIAAVPVLDSAVERAAPPSTFNQYFGGRGTERFSGYSSLDLSLRYQLPVWVRNLDAFIKLDVTNVTDQDGAITFNTTGSFNEVTGTWEPVAGSFGSTSRTSYQIPRQYFVSAGITF